MTLEAFSKAAANTTAPYEERQHIIERQKEIYIKIYNIFAENGYTYKKAIEFLDVVKENLTFGALNSRISARLETHQNTNTTQRDPVDCQPRN